MNLVELWQWMDVLSAMAFSSSEPLEDRAVYARWWAECADEMTMDMELRSALGMSEAQ